MPDWLIWALIGWCMFAVVTRRGAAGCGGKSSAQDRVGGAERRRTVRGVWSDQRQAIPRARTEPRPATPASMEARLRSRYVSGELSVEEYEAELDRLYRRG